VREDDLPLADGSVDRVLLVHALECCPKPGRLLREVWRVLADGGRLVAVVPNRQGLWSLTDSTPFGHGQPYSGGQLARRLTAQLFEPGAERCALYLPPTDSRLLQRLAIPAERLGLGLAPRLGGVVLVEAEKRIYLGTPLRAFEPASAKVRRGYVAAAPRRLAAARRRTLLPPPPAAPGHDLPRAA
jgi:SAM-dependent methyltransferase